MLKILDGKKSYLGAAMIGAAAAGHALGMEPAACDLVRQIGEALLGAGLAHRLTKLQRS